MATLLELKTIFDNAHQSVEEGVTPPAEVVQARELRAKIEAAVWKKAHALMTNERPSDGQAANEATGWAQQALTGGSSASTVFRALLAANADVPAADILGADDAAIEGALNTVVGQLAKGKHPGR